MEDVDFRGSPDYISPYSRETTSLEGDDEPMFSFEKESEGYMVSSNNGSSIIKSVFCEEDFKGIMIFTRDGGVYNSLNQVKEYYFDEPRKIIDEIEAIKEVIARGKL